MVRFSDVVTPPEKEGREKHVPYIEAPSRVKAGEPFQVRVIVGKEVPHPNTVEHHIKWIQIYLKGKGPAAHVATFDLGPTYVEPRVSFTMKLQRSATLYVLEYCNVHGVWENTFDIEVK